MGADEGAGDSHRYPAGARFFYLQKTSFGGRTEGQTFGTSTTGGPRFNLLRVEEDLSMAHLRLASVVIEHLDWHDVVEKYDRPHTLFFMTRLLGYRGYGVEFGRQEYDAMASLARSIRAR